MILTAFIAGRKRSKPASKLVLHSANYAAIEGGGKTYDVAEFMQQIIAGDSLVLDIENHNFVVGDKNFVPKDPKSGKGKRLQITYSYDGEPPLPIERLEHDRLVLPEDSNTKRLSEEVERLKQKPPIFSELALRVLTLASKLNGETKEFIKLHPAPIAARITQPPEAVTLHYEKCVAWKKQFAGWYRSNFAVQVEQASGQLAAHGLGESTLLAAMIDMCGASPSEEKVALIVQKLRFLAIALEGQP